MFQRQIPHEIGRGCSALNHDLQESGWLRGITQIDEIEAQKIPNVFASVVFLCDSRPSVNLFKTPDDRW
jgi:hypothetical protein